MKKLEYILNDVKIVTMFIGLFIINIPVYFIYIAPITYIAKEENKLLEKICTRF